MRILFALTYYRPHISGVTVYTQRLAEALAARGHYVTVLTSQYNTSLPQQETVHGVRIVRVPVAFRVSKGTIMPRYFSIARPLVRSHDLVCINLPSTPSEALLMPCMARLAGKPLAAIYHCDVRLPKGFINRVIDRVVYANNFFAAMLATKIITNTADYARRSPLLKWFSRKSCVIAPPVADRQCQPEAAEAFKSRHVSAESRIIGFIARFATEKGVEYLLKALPAICKQIPNACVLFAGEHRNVIGEKDYRTRLRPLLKQLSGHWKFLGVLSEEDMAAFLRSCEVTVLPSINSTESFGLVQVESMLAGTPVVATDLPGIRVPVMTTGMGRLVPPRDSDALAEALTDVMQNRERYVRPEQEIRSTFSLKKTTDSFEELFHRMESRKCGKDAEYGMRRNHLAEQMRDLPSFRALVRSMECRLYEQSAPLQEPILDIGCGDGHFASTFFRKPLDTGIDLDLKSIGEANRRKAYRHTLSASATHLAFPNASFPTVIANCSIEHIPDIDAVLSEIARVLPENGRFLFTVPSHRLADLLFGSSLLRSAGAKGLARSYGDWFNRQARHYHVYDAPCWEQMLNQHGLSVRQCHYYMAPSAARVLDVLHYVSIPSLVSRKLTGRWIMFPRFSPNRILEKLLQPLYDSALDNTKEGACIFFEAVKNGRTKP